MTNLNENDLIKIEGGVSVMPSTLSDAYYFSSTVAKGMIDFASGAWDRFTQSREANQ